jgi:pimeloyl-ACP methyl ester carboxylesterase
VSCLFPVALRRLTGFPPPGRLLGTQATVIQVDPPGIGAASDRRPLRLATHARALSQAVRRTDDNPTWWWGTASRGWVALRLVVDNRGLVARLLLLDPTPLTLRFMAAFFKLLAVLDRSAGTSS